MMKRDINEKVPSGLRDLAGTQDKISNSFLNENINDKGIEIKRESKHAVRLTRDDLVEIASFYGQGKEKRNGSGFLTLCPGHDDRNPSLSLSIGENGELLVHCHAGCDWRDVKDRIEADFPYIKVEANIDDLPLFIYKNSKPLGEEDFSYFTDTRGISFTAEQRDILREILRLNLYNGRISIVSPMSIRPSGRIRAIHQIFLKEDKKTGQKYHGNKKGAAIWIGRIENVLAIGEGLETCLSFYVATNLPVAVAGDAGNLSNLTIPASVKKVLILVDCDVDDTGQAAAKKAAEVYSANGLDVNLLTPTEDTFKEHREKKDFNDLTPDEIRERLELAEFVSTDVNPSYPSFHSFSGSYKDSILHPVSEDPSFTEGFHGALLNKNRKHLPHSKAAARIASLLKGRCAISSFTGHWYFFNGSHWERFNHGEEKKVFTRLLRIGTDEVGYNTSYKTGVLKELTESGEIDLPKEKPGHIPFENGLLNISRLELEPVTPENAFTWVLPWNYDRSAKCPEFEAFLERAIGDPEVIRLLLGFINACIVGRADLQNFLHLLGSGGTGKSTFCRVIGEILGSHSVTSTTLPQLEQNRFETAAIFGKRLLLFNEENNYNGRINILKAITGRDPIRYEEKGKQQDRPFTFGGQVIMVSNEPLYFKDHTSALERRRVTVEFRRPFTEREKEEWQARGGEEKILYPEIPGIINLALGLSHEEVSKIFRKLPKRVLKSNIDAARDGNPLFDWACERLTYDPEAKTKVGECKKRHELGKTLFENSESQLYPNYCEYCDRTNRTPVSLRKFSHLLIDMARRLGFEVEKKRESTGTMILGLRLCQPNDLPFSQQISMKAEGLDEGSKDPKCLKMNEMKHMKDENASSYKNKKFSEEDDEEEVEEWF